MFGEFGSNSNFETFDGLMVISIRLGSKKRSYV